MQAMRVSSAAVMVAVAVLAGCATVTTPTKGDPFESYNRTMFTINDKIDEVALKPIAKGYVYVTPQPVRDSVTNFFGNIGDIYTAANNLVQLKIADGVSDIMRVVMNSLFGVQLVNTRANLLGAGDVLSGAALDKYSFVRNAYLQRRQYLIGGDNSASDSSESLPKYEDVDSGAAAGAAPASATTATPSVAASGSVAASDATAASEPGATSVRPDQMVPPRIPSFPSFPSFKLR